jgi:hypothetical protein
MTAKTTGASTSIPDMTDDDWQAFAAACSQPTPSGAGRESLASKLTPRDGADTSQEVEEFSTMSADAIVARQRAVEAVPTTSVPLAPAPVAAASPELLELRALRHELHDLTSLMLSIGKRIGPSSGKGK